jgi:hypothetical protein
MPLEIGDQYYYLKNHSSSLLGGRWRRYH